MKRASQEESRSRGNKTLKQSVYVLESEHADNTLLGIVRL